MRAEDVNRDAEEVNQGEEEEEEEEFDPVEWKIKRTRKNDDRYVTITASNSCMVEGGQNLVSEPPVPTPQGVV